MFNGQTLKALRQARGMTKQQLAEILANGSSHPTVSSVDHWERAYSLPDFDTLEKLCGIFNVSPLRFIRDPEGITMPKALVVAILEALDTCETGQAIGMLRGALAMQGLEVTQQSDVSDNVTPISKVDGDAAAG